MIQARFRSALAAAALLLALSGAAEAQKAKDTLRIAFDQPIRLIDAIHNPNPEANVVDRPVLSAARRSSSSRCGCGGDRR